MIRADMSLALSTGVAWRSEKHQGRMLKTQGDEWLTDRRE